ncbi:hypothetical protein TTHERM_00467799 (macronuclear) [Tetrahymena thermophila SB210]|uniref:Uncharacterized protein n=1 Tax=Tetrahymena thermophila (strain SB210) TaxID=312017 RepID=A4VCU2_TETTS|nr:hypothetical protein TTHERM_00467799 [Tetrahymena thermophila SB210]EDK31349.2 hypothetical protein TTHERM_00467799 [Tetrahymena thermophila SB210]|eukprot:XP_001471046.2 hypothetical protein TTHERM_00467799 [Tetrahymena thermophila SB210]
MVTLLFFFNDNQNLIIYNIMKIQMPIAQKLLSEKVYFIFQHLCILYIIFQLKLLFTSNYQEICSQTLIIYIFILQIKLNQDMNHPHSNQMHQNLKTSEETFEEAIRTIISAIDKEGPVNFQANSIREPILQFERAYEQIMIRLVDARKKILIESKMQPM